MLVNEGAELLVNRDQAERAWTPTELAPTPTRSGRKLFARHASVGA